MEKIRILRVIARLNVGGPAIHTILLAAAFENSRYTTRLLAGNESPDEGNMSYLAEEHRVTIHRLPSLQREINLWKDIITFFRLVWEILIYRPHLVHTHTAKAGFVGRSAALFCRMVFRRRMVLVHTFHGHVFHGYFGTRKTRLFIWLERLLARYTQAIITITPGQQQDILAHGVGTSANHSMIPLGLDLDCFYHSPRRRGALLRLLNLNPATRVVGMVTRLVPVKNVAWMLEIARYLSTLRSDIHWVIVGDGEERGKLEQLSHDFHLDDRISWLGFQQQVDWIYSDLDVLVLTSLNEGSPVALIEGMCAGVPVVSTRVGGVPDLIPTPEYGYLCDLGQTEQFGRAILEILDHPDQAEQMAQRNRERIYRHYRFSELVQRLETLYQDLLS